MTPPEPAEPAATARHRAADEVADALRAEVRLLGEALGVVIVEGDGQQLLDDVERLRHAVIAARSERSGSAARGGVHPDAVRRIVEAYSPARAVQVAAAFTAYFQLVNLAEERQRVRALRGRTGPPRPDSFAAAATALGDDLDSRLDGLRIHPVLTAHPTEARRRAVVTAIRRINDALDTGDRARLLEQVTVLWRTAQLRRTRPDPLDEVRTVMAVFDESLFTMVPALYRAFDHAVAGDRAGTGPPRVPSFLRYGSWVGGDRDGNPHVTAAVTRQTLEIQADHVLRALTNATTRIGRTLTLDEDAVPATAELRAALRNARDVSPALLNELAVTAPGEPHRQWLLFLAARLDATRNRNVDLAYRDAREFLGDLKLAQRSLYAGAANRVAFGELQGLIRQVETFGFHLAELEVRQHSRVHADALRELGMNPGDPHALTHAIATAAPIDDSTASPQTREVLATFRTIAALQQRWGVDSCRRYVVSFTSSAADLLAVSALARLALGERVPTLDVVPLFETSDDLAHCTDVLDDWLGHRATGAAAPQSVEVMLGYSDSAKDVGPVSATFALYDAQDRLTTWASRHNIRLTLFHGRGGALGRGGGPAGRAVLSSAPGSLGGRFKVTEQGEVVLARYGSAVIGMRHLEQVTSAVLLATTAAVEQRATDAAGEFAELARRVSEAARDAYRRLVDSAGFAEFVRQVSPLDELGMLHLGSRPARRAPGGDLSTLRAIPWVFAWAQTRCNLPGWYGLGSGLAAVLTDAHGLERLRAAYARWPLFASLLDNAEMSLAKTDRGIAARYLALADRPELADRILAELDRSTELLLAVLDRPRLLDGHPVLRRAVDLRNPYVDALSHLQLRALTECRAAGEAADPLAQRLLLLTINGVAAGLQNTG